MINDEEWFCSCQAVSLFSDYHAWKSCTVLSTKLLWFRTFGVGKNASPYNQANPITTTTILQGVQDLNFKWIYFKNYSVYTPLCSRNFQIVKLRLDFVEIWSFYCHSDFTWNPFRGIRTVQKCYFWQVLEFEQLSSPKFTKIQSSKFGIRQKWHFWIVWIHQNCISRKIGVVVKWSNFNKLKL